MYRRADITGRALPVVLALAALSFLPVPSEAQMGGQRGGGRGGMPMEGVQRQYEMVRDYMLQTARGVPASVLGYRPTDEVRSFGELLGHVANASYAFCSTALGEASPSSTNYEEVMDQAELTRGLEEAFAYCDRAHAEIAGPRMMERVDLFGQTGSRLWVLTFNATHTWEHYGNLVTYMRLNGLVPPSSGGMTGN